MTLAAPRAPSVHRPLPVIATILIGVGQMIWIMLELMSIPFSALMPTFGAVGLALALLPLTSPVQDYLKEG